MLLVHERLIFIDTAAGDRAFRLAAAIDKQELKAAAEAFTRDLAIALGLLGVALLLAAWMQIVVGLAPLNRIRQRINDVRTGVQVRLTDDCPVEVQLLVDELNALLEARDLAVKRARDSAGDLAHGLKTPLAILQAESRTLQEHQMEETALEIDAQVEQMRQRVERHLAVARLRGPGGSIARHTDVEATLKRIVSAMSRMPQGEELDWQLDVPKGLSVALDSHDFVEVFGNLLDNARKWARTEVSVRAVVSPDGDEFVIEDDGPGVPDGQLPDILRRGERLDEGKQGSGLGLSIVQEILKVYDAELSIENRPDGGLRSIIHLPAPCQAASI